MDPLPDLADLIWACDGDVRNPHKEGGRAAGYDLDWHEMWPYAHVAFRLRRGERRVSLDLEPGYDKARCAWMMRNRRSPTCCYARLASMELDRANGRVVLRIAFAEASTLGSIFLQPDPHISCGWKPFGFEFR